MRSLWNTLLKGLAAVLPIGLTIYIVYWLGATAESVLGRAIRFIVPETYYWPGMGLVAGLLLLFIAGVLMNAWAVQRLLGFGEGLLARIPLVKTIYGAIRDFLSFFSAARERGEIRRVVLVSFGDIRLIGFVTREHLDALPGGVPPEDNTVAVYLPMSYQIGGYTLYLPRSRLQPIDLSIDEALRLVLTAGLTTRRAGS